MQLGPVPAHIELWQNTLVNSAEDCTAVHGSIVEYYAVKYCGDCTVQYCEVVYSAVLLGSV